MYLSLFQTTWKYQKAAYFQIVSPIDKGIAQSILDNLEPVESSWDTSVLANNPLCKDPYQEVLKEYNAALDPLCHHRFVCLPVHICLFVWHFVCMCVCVHACVCVCVYKCVFTNVCMVMLDISCRLSFICQNDVYFIECNWYLSGQQEINECVCVCTGKHFSCWCVCVCIYIFIGLCFYYDYIYMIKIKERQQVGIKGPKSSPNAFLRGLFLTTEQG